MNNNLVSPVVSNKFLGVDLDHKLTFHSYIEEICKKICSGIGVTYNFILLVIFLCTHPSCKPAYCFVGLACLLNKFDNNNNKYRGSEYSRKKKLAQ